MGPVVSEEHAMLGRVRQMWLPVRGVWSDRPSTDWAIVAVLVGAHGALVHWADAGLVISELGKADRMRLFTTTASVSALLFGFATASIAFFYGSAQGERIDLMKKVMSRQLVAAWRAALSAPLVTVGVSILALVVDTKVTGNAVVGWACEVAVVLLAVRGIRLRWLFTTTLSLMSLDVSSGPQYAKPTGSPAPSAVAQPKRRTSST